MTDTDIRAFISEFWNDDLKRLNPDNVFKSLGIDGDDAFEFMKEYGERFNVDLYDYRWYFHNGEEGFGLGGVFVKPPYKRVQEIPITISMLVSSANAGKWTLIYPEHNLAEKRYDMMINQIIFGVAILLVIFSLAIKFI